MNRKQNERVMLCLKNMRKQLPNWILFISRKPASSASFVGSLNAGILTCLPKEQLAFSKETGRGMLLVWASALFSLELAVPENFSSLPTQGPGHLQRQDSEGSTLRTLADRVWDWEFAQEFRCSGDKGIVSRWRAGQEVSQNVLASLPLSVKI